MLDTRSRIARRRREFRQRGDDVRHAVGQAEEGFAAHRVREARVEQPRELVVGGGAQLFKGAPGEAFEQKTFVVLEVDQQPAVVGLGDRKSTRLNSSHMSESRMPSSA